MYIGVPIIKIMYIYNIGGPIGSKVKFDEVNTSASLSLSLAYDNAT